MNFLKITLITIHILLELYIFPIYSKGSLNIQIFNVLGTLLRVYLVRRELQKSQSLTILLLFVVRQLFVGYLINLYYPGKEAPDFIKEIILSALFIFSLAFADNKDFEEFQKSEYIPTINLFLNSLIFSNFLTNYLVSFHLNNISNNTDFSPKYFFSYGQKVLVDFAIIYGIFISIDTLKYFNQKNDLFLKKIAKYASFFSIIFLIFYMNFNKIITQRIYDVLFTYCPKPYNMMIYNVFSFNEVIRYKILFSLVYYNVMG